MTDHMFYRLLFLITLLTTYGCAHSRYAKQQTCEAYLESKGVNKDSNKWIGVMSQFPVSYAISEPRSTNRYVCIVTNKEVITRMWDTTINAFETKKNYSGPSHIIEVVGARTNIVLLVNTNDVTYIDVATRIEDLWDYDHKVKKLRIKRFLCPGLHRVIDEQVSKEK